MICSLCGNEIAGQEIGESTTGGWCTCVDAWGYPSAGSGPVPDPYQYFPRPGEAYQPPRPSKRRVAITLLVCVLIVGGGAAAVHFYPKHRSLQANLVAAVHRTAAQKTAQMSMLLNVDAGGQELTATGSGTIDFGHEAFRLDLGVAAPAGTFDMPMILVGGTLYEEVPDLGQVEPGKVWVSIPVDAGSPSQPASIFGAGGDPTGLVDLFGVPEADIIPAGPSVVDDVPTHGYFITFSSAALQQLRVDSRVPAPLRASLSRDVSDLSGTAQIDQSGRMTEQIVNMTIGGSTMSEALNFSGFGSPVHVTSPPAGVVVPIQQFEHDSGGGGVQVL